MDDFSQIIYKRCTIDKSIHPSLYGKYEVYDNKEKFIGRYLTIKESKEAINEKINRHTRRDS